jgi:hypothetical protein
VFQKLAAADGSALWPSAVSFGGFIADLRGSDNGSVIVSMRAGAALVTQKLASANGAPLWGASPLTLSDGAAATGALPNGYFPQFIADGAGGAVFAWQVDGASSTTARAQHVNAAGTRLFADNNFNGVDVSTNNSVDGAGANNQDSPTAAYDATTGDIYVVFEDWFLAGNQPSATFAQRIDSAGQRQWSSSGLAGNGMPLEPYLSFGVSDMTALPVPGGFIAAWSSGGSPGGPVMPTKIVAQRVNADGSFAWSSTTPAPVKTSTATTSRLQSATSTQGYAAFTWVDNDGVGGSGDVRAQNLRYDGLLGKQTGAAPGAPSLTAATDSGASNADRTTNNPAPQFAGTCNSDGDSIGLAIDGAVVGSGPCSGGLYAITLAVAPVDGEHAVKAFESAAGGSSPYSAASTFTMDTTAPLITLNSKPSNPTSSSDATFDFSVDGPQATQCKLDGGAFAACATPVNYTELLVGAHTFAVQATDLAGNTGTTNYAWTIQPDPVPVSLDASTDSGRSNADDVTNAQPLLFTGPCTDGDTIKAFAGALALGTTTCGSGPLGSGMYSISTSAVTTDGNKSISASATRGGLTGPTGTVLHVTIDRHAPAAPTITDPATVGPGPNATVDGGAEINSIVTVSDNGNTLCTALTDDSGNWSCNASFNGSGTQSLTATATDVAGNTSAPSTPFEVNVNVTDLVFKNGFDG